MFVEIKQATESICILDNWITETNPIINVEIPEELCFKQLNDFLFYKYFPQFKKHIENCNEGDDEKLLRYEVLKQKEGFKTFSVEKYFELVTGKLKLVPVFETIKKCDKSTLDLLFQNLIMISFTVERWGQFTLKNAPGDSVKSIPLGNTNLDNYIKQYMPNYNTLGSFAMTSISEIEGITFKIPNKNGDFENQQIYCYSNYSSHDIFKNQTPNRFPSILKLDDFPLLIKKGEVLAQAYNLCLLRLMELLQSYEIHHEIVINTVTEITELIKVGTELYRDFLKNPNFNEAKFIYILRQHTIELSESPAAILLQDFELLPQEKSRFKGFLDHYVVRQKLTLNERILFIEQLLKNEQIINPFLENFLDNYSETNKDTVSLDIILHQNEFNGKNILLKKLIKELITTDFIGEHRVRYAMNLLKKIAPNHSEIIEEKLNTTNWITDKLKKIEATPYFLPPSGANSIAYYGPDVILGNCTKIPNYNIHMINRINVMLPVDQERFWKFDPYKKNNLYTQLLKITNKLNIPIDGNLPPVELKEILIKNPWLASYVTLFESFSLLTSTHDGIIEKYIRKLGKKMPPKEKKTLVSSPDHGTTYMQPKGEILQNTSLQLPSLDIMAQTRKNHLLKNWVRPLKQLNNEGILDTKSFSNESIRTRMKHLFFNRKSELVK